MNAEIKQKWTTTLRSGDYKQGKKQLRPSKNRFCCLGVLCDIYAKDNNIEWEIDEDSSFRFKGSLTMLPPKVRDWADISADGGYGGGSANVSSLASDNDKGKTFAQIARIIEKHF